MRENVLHNDTQPSLHTYRSRVSTVARTQRTAFIRLPVRVPPHTIQYARGPAADLDACTHPSSMAPGWLPPATRRRRPCIHRRRPTAAAVADADGIFDGPVTGPG